MIPKNLQQLSELTSLDIGRTDVCVPADATFQAWLDTLSKFRSSGLVCDGTRRVLFSASNYAMREGESITVTVRLIDQTGDPLRSLAISLTAMPAGGATAADYSGVPESITIMAPRSEASFVVTAVKDESFDDGESIVLGFRRPLPSGSHRRGSGHGYGDNHRSGDRGDDGPGSAGGALSRHWRDGLDQPHQLAERRTALGVVRG